MCGAYSVSSTSESTNYHQANKIDNVTLDAVDRFTYLSSTIDSNLSVDADINTRIAEAAAVMSKLNRRVWQNNNPTQMTKLRVYQACVLSTLLYSSEAWTTYTRQEKKLNSFHLLRRILDISWQDNVTNTEVLEHASSFSIIHAAKPTTFVMARPMSIECITVAFQNTCCTVSVLCQEWLKDVLRRGVAFATDAVHRRHHTGSEDNKISS